MAIPDLTREQLDRLADDVMGTVVIEAIIPIGQTGRIRERIRQLLRDRIGV